MVLEIGGWGKKGLWGNTPNSGKSIHPLGSCVGLLVHDMHYLPITTKNHPSINYFFPRISDLSTKKE